MKYYFLFIASPFVRPLCEFNSEIAIKDLNRKAKALKYFQEALTSYYSLIRNYYYPITFYCFLFYISHTLKKFRDMAEYYR